MIDLAANQHSLAGTRILVVDDGESTQQLVASFLELAEAETNPTRLPNPEFLEPERDVSANKAISAALGRDRIRARRRSRSDRVRDSSRISGPI